MASADKAVPASRRGDPWFDDGNIVLLSEDSSVAFKVHRDFLSRHSEVFKSMFELPQSSSEGEVLEGCQVVRMYDLPGELSNLIKALYDGTGPSSQERSLEHFLYTVGILRLSTKYFISRLRNEAIRHLTPPINDKSYPFVHPLHVLNVARENHVEIVIPSVMYFLSLYSLDDLLKADHLKLKVDHPSCPPSNLSSQDLQAYTLMFQYRITLILDFVRRTCGERVAAPGCQKAGACVKVFTRTSSRLSRSWKVRTGPLHFMVQVSDEIAEHPDVCGPCRRAFRQDVTAFREETWHNLPSIVGLSSWEELETSDLSQTTSPR
ncbi:unnamed protein product [Somion occarium]|uniref:BTB domain-containing protein n=1 Tax=Somion occarium TaxID=3059160 RepID=A0ABP1DZK7_9APHY